MRGHSLVLHAFPLFAVVLAMNAFGSPADAQAVGSYSISKTLKIGAAGSWDYVTVDLQNRRLYLTRTTHTMVIDADSGKVLADIPGQKRSHGVALVPKVGRGFITDGQA